jgi:hypothetical protein
MGTCSDAVLITRAALPMRYLIVTSNHSLIGSFVITTDVALSKRPSIPSKRKMLPVLSLPSKETLSSAFMI